MAIRRIEGLLHLASEGRYAILVGRFNSFGGTPFRRRD